LKLIFNFQNLRKVLLERSAGTQLKSNVKDEIARVLTVWTIGHSTRSSEEFIELLGAQEIELVSDVRAYPSSRRYSQFNRQTLAQSLEVGGIGYQHLPVLGGRRTPAANSKNTVWKNASFRAYADYMETESYELGIQTLLRSAAEKRTAVMCAEAIWWKCHRSLIADDLKSRGLKVLHIISETKLEEHPFTSAARIVKGKLSYRGLLEFEP